MDPSLINESRHNNPLHWKDDRPELAKGKTKGQKDAIREHYWKKAKLDVAAYILTALRFFYEENKDQIFAPYNFSYVKTLANL